MSNKRILLVDDEPHLIRSLAFILDKEGYEIDTAANGEEALQKVQQNKPALIFLDVMMPKKNGYEVCQEIKDSPDLKDIYVIMLSARGQEAAIEQGLKCGANEFLTKPFSPLAIVAKVKEILK
jgi:two-component system, OmpR family, alkaline phosphatase synthesis response regulator PhoP